MKLGLYVKNFAKHYVVLVLDIQDDAKRKSSINPLKNVSESEDKNMKAKLEFNLGMRLFNFWISFNVKFDSSC